jgi:putative SbcD/Mre11-related phosphoesterase
MNKQGILIPRFQVMDTIESLKSIFIKTDRVKKTVITGDFKHEFGSISMQEWEDSMKIIDLILENSDELIIVKGNHDIFLGPIAKKRGISIIDYLYLSNEKIYICHGNKMPNDNDFKRAKTIIIGHQHPAISLREGSRTERYKCFLKGKLGNKNVIVMPSFLHISEGIDILKENIISPFIKDINEFSAYVVGDKTYNFGKTKRLLNK